MGDADSTGEPTLMSDHRRELGEHRHRMLTTPNASGQLINAENTAAWKRCRRQRKSRHREIPLDVQGSR